MYTTGSLIGVLVGYPPAVGQAKVRSNPDPGKGPSVSRHGQVTPFSGGAPFSNLNAYNHVNWDLSDPNWNPMAHDMEVWNRATRKGMPQHYLRPTFNRGYGYSYPIGYGDVGIRITAGYPFMNVGWIAPPTVAGYFNWIKY